MKLKFFAVMFVCLLTVVTGITFAGCGSHPDNIAITVDKTDISLKIYDREMEEGDEFSNSGTLSATLSGLSAEMTRGVFCEFDDPSIATARVTKVEGDKSTIVVTANTAGETTMRVISNENNSAVSEDITVKVYREAQTMSFNTQSAPSLKVGSSMTLNAHDLLEFRINGEKEKVYPCEATFGMLEPTDPRWNNAYGTALPFGVSLQNNVLSAVAQSDCGIVQLEAIMPDGLSAVVYVMVYKDIVQDDIMLYQNNQTVEEIKSVINPINVGDNAVLLKPQVDSSGQNFAFEVKSNNNDVLLVGAPNTFGVCNAVVCNSGYTTVDVNANIIDPLTNIVYRTFTRTYDVKISKIVTEIRLSSDDFSETAAPVTMNIQDVYFNDILGERVRFNVFPQDNENTQAIANTDVVLAVTQIDGVNQMYSEAEGFSDVVVFVNDAPYVWGQPIHTGSDVYVALGQNTSVTSNFKLEFLANTHDETLPVARNSVTFVVEAGVTSITASSSLMTLAVGSTAEFTLVYETKLGMNTGSPKFNFNDKNQEIYSIRDLGFYTYEITALKEGDINVVITADSGKSAVIALQVRVVMDEFSLTIPDRVNGIVERAYYADDTIENGVINKGILSFTIAEDASVDIGYIVGPSSISDTSYEVDMITSTDVQGQYLRIGNSFVNGKLNITALTATPIDAPIMFSVRITHYIMDNNVMFETVSYRQIAITVYRPIDYLYWSGTNSQKVIDRVVLNINHLGLVDREKGSTTVQIEYDSTATYFVKGGEIEWFVEDVDRVRLVEADFGTVHLSAFLDEEDTLSNYTVQVTARIQEYNTVHLLKCIVKIENPVMVSGIEVLNYYDEHNGIRLNDLGVSDRTSFELVTKVNPSNAYNKTLGYMIVDEFGVEVPEEQAIITLDAQNPNIIRAVPGKSGRTWVRIYPVDAIRDESVEVSEIHYKDVLVVVEDGEANAYSIYDPAEFVAIGNSSLAMTKNYILMNSIDLSNYSGFMPLGEGEAFTGSIISAATGNTKYMISGIPAPAIASVESDSYIGLFSKIESSVPGGAIQNIDFYFESGYINLDDVSVGANLYAGLLAGVLVGDLTNVYVGLNNYRTREIVLGGLDNEDRTIYFGAVAGNAEGGNIANVYTDISILFDSIGTTNRLIAGGMFGRFAGLTIGQDDALKCNVKITSNTTTDLDKYALFASGTINEAVGGLVGVAEPYTILGDSPSTQIGVIRSMQVSGVLDTPNCVNVGGLVGQNSITLGTEINGKLYKNLANVRVLGLANAGGLVGLNNGTVSYAIAEVYDVVGEVEPTDLTLASALYRVGGLVGTNTNTGTIYYSYAMSYINRDMVVVGADTNATQYYGDIVSLGEAGGLVGINAGGIFNSFASLQIQQVPTSIYPEATLVEGYVGGLAGKIELAADKNISNAFAVGKILSNTSTAQLLGEFAGYIDTSSSLISQCYAYVEITDIASPVYCFGGTINTINVQQSFYYDENATSIAGAAGKTYDEMRLDIVNTNIYRDAGWGFTGFDNPNKQEWVEYVDSLQGVNKNLPILYDKDGNMLYNQAINDITATPSEYKASGDILPTYFEYKDGEGNSLGMVVLLDNIPLDANSRRIINLMAIADECDGLLNVSVKPENLALDKWTIAAASSDYSIAEIIQPNQSLIGAYVIFKDCGVVTITLRSLLNVNIVYSITINVVGGFNEFVLKDSVNRDMTQPDYVMYIKKGNALGYSIHPSFIQKSDKEYITPKGLVYSTLDVGAIQFAGYTFVDNQVFIRDGEATILSGVVASSDIITFGVAPYIELSFGGNTYKYVFRDLYKNFNAKVYSGLSGVDVYTGTEANMPSGSDVIVSLYATTDNVDTVFIDPNFSLKKNGEAVSSEDIAKYAELLTTRMVKVATSNEFVLFVDGEEVQDKFVAGSIIQSIIEGASVNAYIMIDNLVYSTQDDFISLKDYLIQDCIINTYKISLKGEERVITSNVVFDIEFTVSDIESKDSYTVNDTITFVPADVNRVDLYHYTYGPNSMESGEVAGHLLAPGTSGVLKIEISPYYADFDHVIINSRALDTQNNVMLQQLVYRQGVYRYLSSTVDYDEAGNIILQKITGIDASGQPYFDGRIFVSTLITAGTTEGSRFVVTVAPIHDGAVAFEPRQIDLAATFAPYASLTLDSPYEGNVVARGTVATFRLSGVLQNSRLQFDASYTMSDQTNRLSYATFDLRNVKSEFVSGSRENVDIAIPYYVGLLASPDNGKITITITIKSWTAMGGELNPLIVTSTISIVDYIVDTAFVNGTQTGNLEVSVNSYKSLNVMFVKSTPRLSDFEEYVGYSADAVMAEDEASLFAQTLSTINEKANAKQKLINRLGGGAGGVWWFDAGNGYTQITTSHNYLDFLVIFDDTAGQECYKIRGRDLKTDFPLRLSFESTYLYNATLGCYEFALYDEINDSNRGLVLDDYLRMLSQDFYANLTEQSDEDNPYAIDSAQAFRTVMVAGGNYMLTADIELYNWTPISTAISSLDGNGHIIYLKSFAKTVDTTSQNYGLFGTVSQGTVLKNLIVDVSHTIYTDLQNIATVNFGFIAGENNGIIYNCDVVVTQNNAEWRTIYDNTTSIMSENADEQFGKNIFQNIYNGAEEYQGYNTNASTFILTSKTQNNKNVVANIGGLVGKNNSTGTITNSRVGRVDKDNALGTSVNTSIGGSVYARQGLNLFANGNVGGLAGENSGVISNSYFANGFVVNSRMDIYSKTNTTGARTGGLVAVQTSTGRIVGCYARGQLDEGDTRSTLGGAISYGTVGGLVHSNSGIITNSYSNMNLSSASGMGGFVYENLNNASITYCYSLSKVKTQGLINGMFVGVDNEGNLLDNANSVIKNSFYLAETGAIVDSKERAIGLVQDSWQEPTGSAFEGFAVSIDQDGENTWYMDDQKPYLGPQLYLADKVFVSSRNNNGEVAGYERGSLINPLLITSLDDWQQKIFEYKDDTHKSSFITATNPGSSKNANYLYRDAYIMLLNDIDFGGAIDHITSKTVFSGHLYGNGHLISGLNFTQSVSDLTAPNDFGLFAILRDATVTNLSIIINQELTSRASHVGVLAGSIDNCLIENIMITSTFNSGKITGTNMVGALAGYVTGDSHLYNITANLAISASAATIENRAYTYYNQNVPYSANISYAGAVIGVLDLVETDIDVTSTPRVRNVSVLSTINPNNIKRTVTIDLAGEIVGGVVGLVGANSEIYKAYFDVDTNSIGTAIRGRNMTGGLVGENRGYLLNSRLSLDDDAQMAQDSELLASDDPNSYVGYKNLFASENPSNAVGGLVGLNMGGNIQYSYNRVAVINKNARVAGGLIGLSINAPKQMTSDPVLSYLQDINLDKANLLRPVSGGVQYNIVSGCITPLDHSALSAGAILREVYTTASVQASDAIGGLVGAQINAPIYTFADSLVVGANNYNTADSAYTTAVQNGDILVGSATGYLGLNYGIEPTPSQVVAYIRDLESGVASQDMYLTAKLGTTDITPIGNVSGAMLDDYRATSFMMAGTDPDNKPFENYNKDVWNLDNDKLAHKFPSLKIGYDSPVKDITNVDEFFEELVKTRPNSHYRLVSDIEITGDRWYQFVMSEGNGNKSLGTDASPVRGRLEGAVMTISNGVATPRPAKVTFKNFDLAQMGYFNSLFGYTSSFKLNNMDFVFQFDYLLEAISASDLRDFALIAISSNASTFNNVSLSLRGSDDTPYSMIMDYRGADAKVINMSLFTALAHNSNFNNVRFDARAEVINYANNIEPQFTFGALIGTATGNTTISGVEQGSVGFNYQSNQNYTLNIGGLVGTSSGMLNVSGAVNNTGNISGSVNVDTESYLPVYLGGVVGNPVGSLILRNFTTNIDITLNRTNASALNAGIDYVGGIAGIITNSNIVGANVLGDIMVNSGNSVLYLGGVAGMYENSHIFANTYTGYSTTGSMSHGTISVSGSGYSTIYVGGIYGITRDQITMQNGLSTPAGDGVNVYNALYSTASIYLDVESAYIYAGGLAGFMEQGLMVPNADDPNTFDYTLFATPNNVLRITGSGYTGDIAVDNSQMTDGANYIGGIVATSYLMMQDVYSNGAISFGTQGAAPLYMGGVVGFAYNHLIGAMGYSVINVSRINHQLLNSFVDPIVGDTLTTLDANIVIIIDNVYSSPELNGVYSSFGYLLSVDEVYDSTTATSIMANMPNWYNSEVEVNGKTLSILVPYDIRAMVDYSIGSEIVPVVVSEFSQIFDAMRDYSHIHQTIILSEDVSVSPTYFNKELNNIRRVFGNSYSFVLDDYSNANVSGDFGLFSSIGRNQLISNLGIKFGLINISTTADANIGVLAGSSSGTIFNVSVGALPSVDTDYMGNTQQKTVADFGNGVSNKYLSAILDSQEIATLKVAVLQGNSVIGGLVGTASGYINNTFGSIDMSIRGVGDQSIIGGLVGTSQWASISNVMTNGRLNISLNSTIGGMVGMAQESYIRGAIANVNMGVFVPDYDATLVGYAFGDFVDGEYVGIIANTDISATDSEYFDNELYSLGQTTAKLSSQEALDFILDENNLFDTTLWVQDVTKNYGYPVLNTITNISFDTGDGTQDNPYQIAEASQLLSLVSAKSVYYCLTRDMVVSPQNYAATSQILLVVTELNGLGHTIVIYDLPNVEGEEINYGLFNEISATTMIRNLGIAAVNNITVDSAAKINYGGIAVKNYGTIANCYAITNDAAQNYNYGTIGFNNSLKNSSIGGLVAQNYGDIKNSWTEVNIVGKDGYFGGIVGTQGRDAIQNQDGSVTEVKQATMATCFVNGDIILNDSIDTDTSAGGLIGLNKSILSSGYVVQDCYAYGTTFTVSNPDLNIGTIIGKNESLDSLGKNIINTYRTYSYVAVPTTPTTLGGSVPTGNYLSMGMIGNQSSLDECFDNSSSIVLYYYTTNSNTYPNNGERYEATEYDVANLTTIGSYATANGLRGTLTGQGIYIGWNGANSPWARNTSGVGSNVYAMYLSGVTPQDRQEGMHNTLDANEIFKVN